MNSRLQDRINAMTNDLSLTQTQQDQLTQVFQNWRQKRKGLKNQNDSQQQMREGRREMKQSVENILTPDQKQKYSANEAKYWQGGKENDDDNEN